MQLTAIAHMQSEFPKKFGIPRQSGIAQELRGVIRFAPPYRSPEAVRGLADFSHIWLIWGFSGVEGADWTPTVRPPRLGGNRRVGVFATRSPFRPNPLGLSAVRLESVELHEKGGPLLHVCGADLMNGTPIYDIKPYLPLADAHPGACAGFADEIPWKSLQVVVPPQWKQQIPEEHLAALREVLALDPRPAYQEDPERIYGMAFAELNVEFRVEGDVLIVCGISRR